MVAIIPLRYMLEDDHILLSDASKVKRERVASTHGRQAECDRVTLVGEWLVGEWFAREWAEGLNVCMGGTKQKVAY